MRLEGRTGGMMAECIALVVQLVDGKILDGEREKTTPSAEDGK